MYVTRRPILSLVFAASILAPAVAAPQSAPAGGANKRWLQRVDKNNDGQISEAERQEARQRMQGNRQTAQASGRKAIPLPRDARVTRDIEFASVDGKSLKLDLYLPPKSEAKIAMPVIVWIHGGGWQAGSKENCPFAFMCGEGYAVASINYRLTDAAVFPAQIYDCKAAIRWLRAHAKEYGLDPDRIGVAGSSAGGHLVALLGTSGDVKANEGTVGGNTQYSSRVQAVADFCGPAALADDGAIMPDDAEKRDHKALTKLLGGPLKENRDKARQASPVTFVSKDDPPFLIVHGDHDPLVPINQGEVLTARLKAAGVPVTFHVVKGGGHGVVLPETVKLAKEFFDQHLLGKSSVHGATHTKPAK